MNASCPTCGRVFDPLRSAATRILGGRVIVYCSPECKAGVPETVAAASEPVEMVETVEIVVESPASGPSLPIGSAAAAPVAPARPRPVYRGKAAAVLVLAGAAAAAVAIASTRTTTPATAASVPVPAAAPVPVAAPIRVAPPVATAPAKADPQKLFADAKAALAAALDDPSPRVRLLAAMALSRAGDSRALAELVAALDKDPSEIRRVEVAVALARAGDARGPEHLVAQLRSTRRDVRLEAARSLALLGDARGRDRLREALDAVQLRLGAAEALAAIGDQQGIQILKQALVGAGPESRLRAAVALGRAGDDTARAVLQGIVADGKLEIGAEGALARLGDRSTIPALERALRLSALRVEAAVELRRLAAPVDATALAAALQSETDAGRISAAEAALVLLSPTPPAELR